MRLLHSNIQLVLINAAEGVLLENSGEIILFNEQYVTYVLKTNDVSYDNVFDQFFASQRNDKCGVSHRAQYNASLTASALTFFIETTKKMRPAVKMFSALKETKRHIFAVDQRTHPCFIATYVQFVN